MTVAVLMRVRSSFVTTDTFDWLKEEFYSWSLIDLSSFEVITDVFALL